MNLLKYNRSTLFYKNNGSNITFLTLCTTSIFEKRENVLFVSWLVKCNPCSWTYVENPLAPSPKIVHPVSDSRTWKPYPIQWHISVKDLIREYPPGKGHLYKMNKSVKRTPRVLLVPALLYSLYLTLFKMDISQSKKDSQYWSQSTRLDPSPWSLLYIHNRTCSQFHYTTLNNTSLKLSTIVLNISKRILFTKCHDLLLSVIN